MRNLEDIKRQIFLEVQHAQDQRTATGSGEYYLYYHATTAERDGGILALQHDPRAGYYQITGQRIPKNKTAAEYVAELLNRNILQRLPVLEIYRNEPHKRAAAKEQSEMLFRGV